MLDALFFFFFYFHHYQNVIIIVWIFEAINQSSQSAEDFLLSILALCLARFSWICGLFLLAISLESCPMDFRPEFALYLAYLFHKAVS